jgi:uncharacterized protein (TIGR03083 family)
MLQETPTILVVDRFPPLLDALIDLLSGLSSEEWNLPVHAGEWTVKDLAQHLLGDEINILSGKRDGYTEMLAPTNSWAELVDLINRRNGQWVQATRRLSPRLICELLRITGEQVNAYYRQVDLYAMGGPVSWAGPGPAPVWLDIAREFTERWHHQQHIRDAVGQPGLVDRFFLSPVLDAFAHALPRAFQKVISPEGTIISLTVTGEAGGSWSTKSEQGYWKLYRGKPDYADAEVELAQDTAWRLFTKGITKEKAREQTVLLGDRVLGEKLLEMVSIIA